VPAGRMSMRKTKELLRIRFELGLGQRQIARSCGMGLGRVHDYLERAAAAGTDPPHFPPRDRGRFPHDSEVIEKSGERGRNRTFNLLIKR
jgi:hypothetical protein